VDKPLRCFLSRWTKATVTRRKSLGRAEAARPRLLDASWDGIFGQGFPQLAESTAGDSNRGLAALARQL